MECIWLFKLHTLPGQVENQERKWSLCHRALLNTAGRAQPQELGPARAVSTAFARPEAQLTLSSPIYCSSCPGDPFRKMSLPFPSLHPLHSHPQINHLSHFHHEGYSYSRSNAIILMFVHRFIQDLPKVSAEPCSSPILYSLVPAISYSPADWHHQQMMIQQLIVIITCKHTYRIQCIHGKAPDLPHRAAIPSERGVSRVLQWAHVP